MQSKKHVFRGLSPFFTVPPGNTAVLRDAAAEIRPPLRVKILVFAGRIWYNKEKIQSNGFARWKKTM